MTCCEPTPVSDWEPRHEYRPERGKEEEGMRGIGIAMIAAVSLPVTGCSLSVLQDERAANASSQPFLATGLAGTWQVSDGSFAQTVVLDCEGTGRYAWQYGKVVTTKVEGDYWVGTWHQSGNDREGGFAVHVSDDRAKAEGHWWYSRIGEKHFRPGEEGDTLTLTRSRDAQRGQVQVDCSRQTIH